MTVRNFAKSHLLFGTMLLFIVSSCVYAVMPIKRFITNQFEYNQNVLRQKINKKKNEVNQQLKLFFLFFA